MKDITLVVTGLTRCGSSLMMQMLYAGGYPISCSPGNEAISGEHESQIHTLKEIALGHAVGKAIKSLDPVNFPLPPNNNYIFFWMQRDYSEQAKSISKFLRTFLGIKPGRKDRREIEINLPTDTEKAIKYLQKLGTVYRFNFEDCIKKNEEVIDSISKIVTGLNLDKMRGVVIDRGVECYDGLLESEIIRRHERNKANP